MTETVLSMTGMDVAPYSARGLSQSLEPISASGQLRRTINGELIDLSSAQMRKFSSVIRGTDQLSPAVNGIWVGSTVTVDCIVELAYITATGEAPERTIVTGSSRTEGAFTYYRPQLVMMVTGWDIDHDEYGQQVGWSLSLEEV